MLALRRNKIDFTVLLENYDMVIYETLLAC